MPIIKEFTAKPQVFAAAVGWVAKWVATRPVEPVHAGILMSVADGTLTLSAYGENASARATVDVDGPGSGQAIVSGRLLAELVGTFPDKPVTIEGDDDHVVIRAGRFHVGLPTLAEADYPALPGALPPIGTVSGEAFADAIARAGVACGKDPSKGMVFAAIHLGFGGDAITVLSSDKIRAAGITIPWAPNGDVTGVSATPLGTALIDAAAAFVGPDDITIGLSSGLISLTSPTRSVTMTMLDLQNGYPVEQFTGYLGAQQDHHAVVAVADMTRPLKRAALVRGKDGPVRLTFSTDMIEIASKAEEIKQEGGEEVDATYDGPDFPLAFNPKYLGDALGTVPGATVDIGFGNPKMPVVLTSPDDPRWRHILVPIRLPQ